ncbi:adenylyl cyclase-associated protein, partial [Cryptococcus deuterogattii LA55]
MAASQGMHSMSTILKRLEAVTSRLEDIAVTHTGHASPAKSPPPAVAAPPDSPPSPDSPASKAYQDEIINGALKDFLSKSEHVGGLVAEHSALLGPLCHAQLAFLQLASRHAKPPTPTALAPLLQTQGKAIEAVMEAKDRLSRSKDGRDWAVCFNVLGEGVPAWGWVQVEPAPAPYVGEMKNAAQFWCDRVIKQYKETNAEAVAWAKSFIALVAALESYVKQWHTTGVVWNPKGSPAPSSMPETSSAPPPPPPPPPPSGSAPAPSAPPASGTAALLADLNRGGAVTSGLRKVDSSQMTHKNPALRSAGTTVVPDNAKKAPPLKPKPGAKPVKKPAKIELEDGNKWIIENQEDNKSIKIENTELHHTVHIFSCVNSVVQISGKINAVTM